MRFMVSQQWPEVVKGEIGRNAFVKVKPSRLGFCDSGRMVFVGLSDALLQDCYNYMYHIKFKISDNVEQVIFCLFLSVNLF